MTPTQLGPYLIHEPLGKGGMGSVYRAEHVNTAEAVAVKALSPALAGSEGFRDRFRAEIESLQTLRHAGIVRLYGYGEQDGTLFYAMELVDGPSLEDEIRAGRRFDWRETTDIAIQICRALKHAHDHGVIHRDIKPANVLLGSRNQTKLADFGIARLFGATGLTVSGGVLGTADYMSPEQASGEPVTARCDQYSLGGVMYALLAGRPPFRARDLPTMLQMQRYAIPESVRRYAPDTPADLDNAVLQLLAKEPKDRFPNTLVLAKHLEAMSRALGRTAADDFELYDPNAVEPPPAPDDRELAVTRDATDHAPTPAVGPMTSASTPAVSGSPPAARDAAATDAAPATRYTTVHAPTEEAPPFWQPLLGQAFVLFVAIGTLAAAAWWWTTPLDADALFDRVAARHERGQSDRIAREGVDEFLERFSDDERAGLVADWRRAIELKRMKKRITLTRLARGLPESPAPELLYRRAVEIAQRDAAAGADAFQALADLLTAGGSADGEEAAYADLAREEAERLRHGHREAQRQLAAYAKTRLKAARQRLATDRATAARIANGVLRLVERDEITAPVIDEAKALLALARRTD